MLQLPTYAIKQVISNGMAQSGLFQSRATFYKRNDDPSEAVDEYGQVDLINFSVVAGLENIRCMFAPQNVATPNQGDTTRTAEQIDSKTQFHLLLAGFYPAVQQRYLVKVDDSVYYEVQGAEPDSQKSQMRCAVREWGI